MLLKQPPATNQCSLIKRQVMTIHIIAKKHPLTQEMAVYCSEEQLKATQQARRAFALPRKKKISYFFFRALGLRTFN